MMARQRTMRQRQRSGGAFAVAAATAVLLTLSVLLLLFAPLVRGTAVPAETYEDRLTITPLPNGYVSAGFEFTMTYAAAASDPGQCKCGVSASVAA